MKSSVTRLAHAKINLFLDVTGKRDDGYHTIAGIMQSIPLCDEVTVSLQDRPDLSPSQSPITLTCSRPDIPTDQRNLGYKAAQRFIEAAGQGMADGAHGICIDIQKRIPASGGMAGGSTDAAAVLLKTKALLTAKLLPTAKALPKALAKAPA